MSKTLYHYDPDTGLLLSTSEAQIDPRATKRTGETVYLYPPNTTDIAPEDTVPPKRIQIFDITSRSWRITDDFRGDKVINIETKEIVDWKKLGPIPKGYSKDIPEDILIPYIAWDGEKFSLTEEGKKEMLDTIWEMFKADRDNACSSDIEYNGNKIHVDQTSLNDITLAAQEAILSQDMTTTRRWVAADSQDVQLCGNDFVAIMKAYGARRQQLVFTSNEEWNKIAAKSDEDIISIFKSMNAVVEG